MNRVKLVQKSETSGELTATYEAIEKARGGSVPNMFMALGYNNGMLSSAFDVAAFIGAPSRVPPKDKQIAYLAASRINGCEYCLVRHTAAAMKAGLTSEQAAAFQREGNISSDPAFDARERLIVEMGEELTRTPALSAATFDSLRSYFDDEELVELVFSVAAANMFTRIASALEIELEPGFKK
ncbi:MAG: carboxymuconolactone decarboxylase family protein [Chloroflexi bacterium]|uniref:Carboxymuconolactone decarboxylase family protein n=1 Tax=Candidatus Chlorohelix allophototropha TaxID=3003348 RepID=A0A8T7LYJ6_9CHLR|nr:carboxymuconolactone decarboxylase family protein [Chloroflexota bacterium]WJW67877.1 carboxymuconolactone decarboxylase family protein [Chloroflexota bacterium L227-S17]